MAEDYSLTHKESFLEGSGHSSGSHKKRFLHGNHDTNQSGTRDDEKSEHSDTTTSSIKAPENTGDQEKNSSKKKVGCSYGKKNGHHISEC